MSTCIATIKFQSPRDMILARQLAGDIAGLLGCANHEQTRIATAVSETIRDCLRHGGVEVVDFFVREADQRTVLEIRVVASMADPAALTSALAKANSIEQHLVSGLTAAKRLMDYFSLEPTEVGGRLITLGLFLPKGTRMSAEDVRTLSQQISSRKPRDAMEEMRQRNEELLGVLEEVRTRSLELVELNKELEDTNRGVLALHNELQQHSEQLRKANELKTRFISEMSHEFRTPINSILSLCQILLGLMDGDLTPEQKKQVEFIQKSAEDLSNLVNDLLDLAKIEAGKIDVHVSEFGVANLFGALEGVMKPLVVSEEVQLIFEGPTGLPNIFTDEAKVSQIMRNLISNAIKFTERGEVRVRAALHSEAELVVFSVADTGIGIKSEQQDMIFQEFVQLCSPVPHKVKGTGLGLSLSKKLAELLGGTISFESRFGEGSTFYAAVPIRYQRQLNSKGAPWSLKAPQEDKGVILILEDDLESVLIYKKFLQDTGFKIVSAASTTEAREILSQITPKIIILDIILGGEPEGWDFLAELKHGIATKDIRVLIVTVLEDRQRGMMLGAQDFCTKPIDRQDLLNKLRTISFGKKLLIIDDEEVSRYIMKGLLAGTQWELIEASSGQEGIAKALKEKPDAITLDLAMPHMSGFEVLSELKADPRTRDIPVIIVTSKDLNDDERAELEKSALKVLSKHAMSREETIRSLGQELEKIHMA